MAFSPALFVLGLGVVNFGAITTVPTPPAITSDGGGATATVDVNTGDTAVTTVTASGTGTKTFSIIGGDERLMFGINSSSGALVFGAASVDGNYSVTVAATSDWGRDTQAITVAVAAAPSYTGPLDLVPGAVVAYSAARALSAAWIGQNVIKLRRDSDDATMDFVAGVDGSIDVAAVTTWLSGATAYVHTLYDQSGNGKNILGVPDAENLWTPNTIGGRPALTDDVGVTEAMAGISPVTLVSGGHTIVWVCRESNNFKGVDAGTGSFNDFGGQQPTIQGSAENAVDQYGAIFESISTDFHVVNSAATTGMHSCRSDGVELAEASDFDNGGAVTLCGGNLSLGVFGETNISLCDLLLYDAVVSSGNRDLLDTNCGAYYGITIS